MNLHGDSISGPVVATRMDVMNGLRHDRVVTPATLSDYLWSPPPIGSTCPNKVMASGLVAQTISGPVVATVRDVKQGFSNEKVVTPYALRGLQLENVPELLEAIRKLQTRIEILEKEVRTLTLSERIPSDLAALAVSYE